MIWGKTKHQRQADLESWRRRFAYVPVCLWDGRWIWWGWYFERVSQSSPSHSNGVFMRPLVQRFLVVPVPEGCPRGRPPRSR